MRILLIILGFFLSLSAAAQIVPEDPSDDFLKFIEGVKEEARQKGITQETIDQAFQDIRYLKRVIKRDRNQPEVKQTYARYLKLRVSEWRTRKGKEMMQQHGSLLKEIGAAYGVQPRFIAAIWGIETNYGTVPLSYSVFDALATLAYDPRRAKRFRRELLDVLTIVDKGFADLENMKGSWAGAMGQPQFMPAAYLAHAQDWDGDGKKDIWTNKADVFASIAKYLKHHKITAAYTWGRPVMAPSERKETDYIGIQADGLTPAKVCRSFKSMGAWRKLSEWNELGFRRLNGQDLPEVDIMAAYIAGDEGDGQGYLVYQNFCSIMRYNPSFKYALGVGLLADKIK
ncbi:lytic murein transglycosylase [Temperatibacter marinus]|uniref:Lytic murein transglycosylase n=1 Tax=Temperatibacter marinus TaxID=1456591 RepID=A0AA52EGB3_9PROT|nr:lytic murein transglycosylase [Temperatibacter marinus]WND02260.1 lytic murein transglycosylase [Temperatibacter marinus]